MQTMLTIECKVLGRTRPLEPDWSIPAPPEWSAFGGNPRLRDLIAHVVREEVDAFRDRQAARRLLQVISAREIEEGARRGKIEMGGSDLDQPVDAESAVGVALQGFVDGLYYVFVDDVQQQDLESPVTLKSDSRLTFLRLVALVGG